MKRKGKGSGLRLPSARGMGARQEAAVLRRGGALEWAVLRRRQSEVDVVDVGRRPPPAEGAPAVQPSDLPKVRGRLTLGLAADQVLFRVADLPSTSAEELRGMVELQVDRFSPFPLEHMVVSHEVFGAHEENSRILMVAVQRTVLDEAAAPWKAAGLSPARVDVDLLGWWAALGEREEVRSAPRTLHLRLDAAGAELLVVHDGLPMVARCVGRGDLNAEELAEEIHFTLTTLETEWGAAGDPRAYVWSADAAGEDVARRIRAECGISVECRSLDELMSLSEGLARRALSDGAGRLDLTPQDWSQERRTRAAARRLVLAAAAVIGVWLLVVGTFLGALAFREAGLERLKKKVDEEEKPAAEVKQLQTRVRLLEIHADRRHSALEILRAVSSVMPEGITLSSYSYKKAKTLSLKGRTTAVSRVYDFMTALEKSGLFKEVKSEGITTQGTMSEFRVNAVLPGDSP